MMAMTTSSSMSVNPRRSRSPFTVWHPVESLAIRQAVHVEYIVACLRILGRRRVTSQAPGVDGLGAFLGQWIRRQAPQEVQLLMHRAADVLDAHDQVAELVWIAGFTDA